MEKKMTMRRAKALETKNRILEVANKLILVKEYEEITIPEIAQEAGIAVGTIYHYFSSKEELFFSGYQAFDAKLRDYTEGKEYGCCLDAIRDVIRFQTSSANKAGPAFRAKEIRVQLSTHSHFVLDRNRFLHTYLTHLIETAIERGELRACSAEELAYTILRMVRGDLFDWALRLSIEPAEKNPLRDLEIILEYYQA